MQTDAPRSRTWFRVAPGVLAPGLLAFSALLVHPVLEQGINDDWSYTRSAQVLAATGHVVYNGWATAMLGWQLYLAATFVHLFGFSFTLVRLTTLLVALATAFLMYLCLWRGGVRAGNAAACVCLLALSPLALPLTFSFMTDLSGVFVIVLCLYACLRTLSAQTSLGAIAWLAVAVISNALGGTARQIAWLGALVMVPCLLWLLRRRWPVVAAGLILEAAAILFIAGAMRWFSRQPYTLRDPILPPTFAIRELKTLGVSLLQALLEAGTLLLPVLAAFVPAVPWRKRGAQCVLLATLAVSIAAPVLLARRGQLSTITQPTLGNVLSVRGAIDIADTLGVRPRVVPVWLGVSLSAASLLALAAACCVGWFRPQRAQDDLSSARPASGTAAVAPRTLLWLLFPFALAYLALLLPRAAQQGGLFDRYLLPLLFIAAFALLLLYQRRVAARLPWYTAALVGLFVLFALVITHDEFALYRAQASAIHELESARIPPSEISGGFEFNAWNEVVRTGYVADPRLPGQRPPPPPDAADRCAPAMIHLTPHLDRHFALAYKPTLCLGPAGFPPVPYITWLPPQRRFLYIVRDRNPS